MARNLFFDVELSYNGFHGTLDAASIKRTVNQLDIFLPPFSAREDKVRMPVCLPETAENMKSLFRQRYQSILVALGIRI